jgi:hypothetical protein
MGGPERGASECRANLAKWQKVTNIEANRGGRTPEVRDDLS